jgi:hypothetical protein
MLLRLAGPERVLQVDWDRIEFRLTDRWGWPVYRTLWMAHPLRMTKTETAHLFQSQLSLEQIIKILGCQGLEDVTPSATFAPPRLAFESVGNNERSQVASGVSPAVAQTNHDDGLPPRTLFHE